MVFCYLLLIPKEFGQLVLHRILEDECLDINEFESNAQAYREIGEFVKKYNTKRIHSFTKFMVPSEYYEYLRNTDETVCIAL